ncbi:phage major tail tube protein [Francisella philomiragia]|uniref:phage major tail tube protein n=1 Tax=Francisella philomiragia TaxID=28110 RepID=UPI001C9D7136|nr:phage major tail tube protein [Francisella philomiragia]MBY7733498.1 phage major tail tube protein [Francisella philomiragia]
MFNGLLLNWSLYVDGANLLGIVTQATLPSITPMMQEIYGAGMSAPVDHDTGKVEKMEFTASIDGFQKNVYKAIGNFEVPIIVRGKIRNNSGDNEQLIAEMRGCITVEAPQIEPNAKGSTNIKVSLQYYRLNIAGEDIVEVDALNGVRNIAGVNQLAGIL